jgi:hypothetical protein
MTISDITQTTFQSTDQLLIAILVMLAIVVLLIYLSRHSIKNRWLNFKMDYRLNRLGLKQMANVQWPDGLGHYFTIDRLIMHRDGISLLVYKRFPGKIFCADKMNDWTQMLGKRSYRFKNPFYDLDYQVKAVSSCIPDVPVNGYLFFDHHAEFPKGHPEWVIQHKKLPAELQPVEKLEARAAVVAAWKKLMTVAKKEGGRNQAA